MEKYKTQLAALLEERILLQRQYRKESRGKLNPVYAAAVAPINNQLARIRRQLRVWEERQAHLQSIADRLESFFSVQVYQSLNRKDRTFQLARKLFYKWCLEHGFQSPIIMAFVGSTAPRGRYYATWARRQFTRSFANNIYHKDTWHRFSNFMKQHYQPQKLAA